MKLHLTANLKSLRRKNESQILKENRQPLKRQKLGATSISIVQAMGAELIDELLVAEKSN